MPIDIQNSPCNSSPYIENLSTAEQQQQHLLAAKKLFELYQQGDPKTIELLSQRYPELGSGSSISLFDVRMYVARESTLMQRLSLEKLKKDAKRLLKAINAGKAEAILRLQQFHPRYQQLVSTEIKLADAQLVLARENALPSWPKLKAHIQSMDQVAGQLQGVTAPDHDCKTIHIRCGSDIKQPLLDCGFEGDFIESNSAFPLGEVPLFDTLEGSISHYARVRADFLQSAFTPFMPANLQGVMASAEQSTVDLIERLQHLPKSVQRIILWYEHDPYDQLDLSFILYNLSIQSSINLQNVAIELVETGNFPGIKRFIGIGQLAQQPESLLLLWRQRRLLSAEEIGFGANIWRAFCEQTPARLWQLSTRVDELMPIMKKAMIRVLQELPSSANGLSKTQILTLKIVDDHDGISAGQAFSLLNCEYESLPYLGDIMYFFEIQQLLEGQSPPLALQASDGEGFAKQRLTLTQTGRALLAGELNWLSLSSAERWLGGVCGKPGGSLWCWSELQQRPVYLDAPLASKAHVQKD